MTISQYILKIEDNNRRNAYEKLWNIVANRIPEGFEYDFAYGIPGFCVPKSLYPSGYHVSPSIPLPFIGLASQKNYISLYHMGLYADPALMNWFLTNWPQETVGKPDMGKSCVRFKNADKIPFELIGDLTARLKVTEYVRIYEEMILKR